MRASTFWVFVIPVLNVLSRVLKCPSRRCNLNLRGVSPLPSLPSPSPLRDATSPKVRGLGSLPKIAGLLCYAKLSPPFRAISLAKNFNLWYTVKKT